MISVIVGEFSSAPVPKGQVRDVSVIREALETGDAPLTDISCKCSYTILPLNKKELELTAGFAERVNCVTE